MSIRTILFLLFLTSSLSALSQTEAFLELEPFEKIAKKQPFVLDNQKWFEGMVKEEREFEKDYFVVYHASQGFLLFQDLLKILYDLPDDFLYLRTPWKEIYTINTKEDYFKQFGIPTLPERSFEMQREWLKICFEVINLHLDLSTLSNENLLNLHSIFFKLWLDVEPVPHEIEWVKHLIPHAIDVFKTFSAKIGSLHSSSESRPKIEALKKIELDYSQDIDSRCRNFQKHLLAVNLTLFSNYDSLGDCTVEYWHHGRNHIPIPQDKLLLEILEHFKLDPSLLKDLNAIYEPLKLEDKVIFAIYIPKNIINEVMYFSFSFYEPVEFENYTPHSVLSAFQTNMKSIDGYKNLQGRLIFTQKYLLNPKSGILIRRHHRIDPLQYQKSFTALKSLIQKNLPKS